MSAALATVDPDAGDTHTLSLVANGGGRFALSGNQIVVAAGAVLNYEAATSHTVCADDRRRRSAYDETFTITVTNVNEIVSFDVQRGPRSDPTCAMLISCSKAPTVLSNSLPKAGSD